MYGPNFVAASILGHQVSIDVDTAYPFEDEIRMTIKVRQSASIRFPLKLRIPGWCSDPRISVNGQEVPVDENGFTTILRSWSDGDKVVLTFPMKVVATRSVTVSNGNRTFDPTHPWRGMNTTGGLPFCHVQYGPLLFALPLEQGGEHGLAIQCEADTMKVSTGPMPARPWDWPLKSPITITAL